MTEHTPTPWRTLPQIPTGIFAADEAGSKVAATKGQHGFPDVPEKVARANAAFIVKAVNSHEALLAAAEKVLAGLNARIDAADKSAVPVFSGIAELHSAIHLAKGAA